MQSFCCVRAWAVLLALQWATAAAAQSASGRVLPAGVELPTPQGFVATMFGVPEQPNPLPPNSYRGTYVSPAPRAGAHGRPPAAG